MRDEWSEYLLPRMLIALFGKKRLKYVYPVFIGIVILVIALIFYLAKSPQEKAFPIIALVFVFVYALVDVFRMLRRNSIRDLQSNEVNDLLEKDQVAASVIEAEPEPEPVHISPATSSTHGYDVEAEPGPAVVHNSSKPPSSLGYYLAGGLLSVVLMFPVILAGYFVISFLSKGMDSGTALAFATLMFISFCVLSPFAGLIGAISTGIAIRSARKYSPNANINTPFFLTVITVAIFAGMVGVAIQYYVICIEGQVCRF